MLSSSPILSISDTKPGSQINFTTSNYKPNKQLRYIFYGSSSIGGQRSACESNTSKHDFNTLLTSFSRNSNLISVHCSASALDARNSYVLAWCRYCAVFVVSKRLSHTFANVYSLSSCVKLFSILICVNRSVKISNKIIASIIVRKAKFSSIQVNLNVPVVRLTKLEVLIAFIIALIY